MFKKWHIFLAQIKELSAADFYMQTPFLLKQFCIQSDLMD